MAKMENGKMLNVHHDPVFRYDSSLSTITSAIQSDLVRRLEDENDDMQLIIEDTLDYLEWIGDNHG